MSLSKQDKKILLQEKLIRIEEEISKLESKPQIYLDKKVQLSKMPPS